MCDQDKVRGVSVKVRVGRQGCLCGDLPSAATSDEVGPRATPNACPCLSFYATFNTNVQTSSARPTSQRNRFFLQRRHAACIFVVASLPCAAFCPPSRACSSPGMHSDAKATFPCAANVHIDRPSSFAHPKQVTPTSHSYSLRVDTVE